MKRYGLLGEHLGHSFSQAWFTAKFNADRLTDHRYDPFELPAIEGLPGLLENTPGLRGLNVTIPYKQSVIPFLSAVDPLAAAVGAVNTIAIRPNGLTGHNTDVHGFRTLLTPLVEHLRTPGSDIKTRALVLGTGGASRAVAYVLRELGIRFRTVSRERGKGDLTWDLLDPTIVGVCKLIINCTPLGMYPNVDTLPPLPYAAITPEHVLVDLVYNPEETRFLQMGRASGAVTAGGLPMLKAQAEEAWRIWTAA